MISEHVIVLIPGVQREAQNKLIPVTENLTPSSDLHSRDEGGGAQTHLEAKYSCT